jgi:hypothetical protein
MSRTAARENRRTGRRDTRRWPQRLPPARGVSGKDAIMEMSDRQHGAGTGPDGGCVGYAPRRVEDERPFDWTTYFAKRCFEKRALYGEDPAEIRGIFELWYKAFQRANYIECSLIEHVVYPVLWIKRFRKGLAAHEFLLIERIRPEWRAAAESALEPAKIRLAYDSPVAVAELKQSRHGCLWLIECFEAFAWRLDRLPIDDRAAVRSHVLCLEVHGSAALAYYAAHGPVGPGLDLTAPGAPAPGSIGRLRAVMEWELPRLRVLYERLRSEGDGPAEDAAIAEAIERNERRAEIIRTHRRFERAFQRSYQFLLEFCRREPPPGFPAKHPAPKPRKPAAPRKKQTKK